MKVSTNTESSEVKSILENVINADYRDERDRLHALTGIIYHTIPEMFEKRFEPEGVEFYCRGTAQKIYAWQLCENIARKLLGLEVKTAKGDSWEDAQRRAGYIK